MSSQDYGDDVTVVDFEEGTGVDALEDPLETLARLRRTSRLLDSAVTVPGTSYRIGLDPIVGLLPGVGDVPTTVVSAYIVVEAARLGVPRATLARMVANLGIDAVVGSVPLVGDVFDAVWKANDRNVALLERRLDEPGGGTRDRWVLFGLGALLVGCLLAISLASLLLAGWLLHAVGLL